MSQRARPTWQTFWKITLTFIHPFNNSGVGSSATRACSTSTHSLFWPRFLFTHQAVPCPKQWLVCFETSSQQQHHHTIENRDPSTSNVYNKGRHCACTATTMKASPEGTKPFLPLHPLINLIAASWIFSSIFGHFLSCVGFFYLLTGEEYSSEVHPYKFSPSVRPNSPCRPFSLC